MQIKKSMSPHFLQKAGSELCNTGHSENAAVYVYP